MTNRREFLQTGMSVSAWPLVVHGLVSSESVSARVAEDSVSVHKAVFDDRYSEGRAFADAAAGFGVPVSRLDDGDITAIWDELDRLWRTVPAAIAGSTQHGPLFVLERLASQRGMRVVVRVEHEARADGTLAHVVTGPSKTIAMAAHLGRRKDVEWPSLMAALLTHCRVDGSAPVEQTILTRGARPVLKRTPGSTDAPSPVIHYYAPQAIQEGRGVPWDGPLFSWLIAPRA